MITLPLSVTIRSRGKFVVLLACAGLMRSIAAFYFIRYLIKAYTGLVGDYPEVRLEDDRLLFAPRSPESPALRAGIIPEKDQIIAVNGSPIQTMLDLFRWESAYYQFEPLGVTVKDDAGAVRTV